MINGKNILCRYTHSLTYRLLVFFWNIQYKSIKSNSGQWWKQEICGAIEHCNFFVYYPFRADKKCVVIKLLLNKNLVRLITKSKKQKKKLLHALYFTFYFVCFFCVANGWSIGAIESMVKFEVCDYDVIHVSQ